MTYGAKGKGKISIPFASEEEFIAYNGSNGRIEAAIDRLKQQ